jgi:hypothetical protein
MHRILLVLGSFAAFAAAGSADVILRGPFGGAIVVGTSSGPPTAVSRSSTSEPPIVSTSRPVVRPEMDGETLPAPKVVRTGMSSGPTTQPDVVVGPPPQPVVAPILPRDFAKTFKPGPEPATYEVLFLHPVSRQCVNVCFNLPPGCPRVSYCLGSLVFDYGRHEVEIRFKLGGKVVVTQR